MLFTLVPPKFIENRTSSDVEVKEGESVDLRCAAQATPEPEIRWRRENNQEIQVRSGTSTKKGKRRLFQMFECLMVCDEVSGNLLAEIQLNNIGLSCLVRTQKRWKPKSGNFQRTPFSRTDL